MKFTVILPIHNESKMLKYSLPSIFKLNPDEILCLLDRCSDNSREVIRVIAEQYNFLDRCNFIDIEISSPNWRNRLNFLQLIGRFKANNDYVLFTACDLILDSKIKDLLPNLQNNVQLLSFMHINYPVDISNLMKRLRIKLGLFRELRKYSGLGGVLFFNRKTAFMLEDIDILKKAESGHDTLLQIAISSKFKTRCFLTNTIHLRPRGKKRDYLCGKLFWSVAHRPLWIVVLSGLWSVRLNLIKGYIHERFIKGEDKK